MNWDWDKLQEKRQHQQGRPAPDKSRRNEPDPQGAVPTGGRPNPGGAETDATDAIRCKP